MALGRCSSMTASYAAAAAAGGSGSDDRRLACELVRYSSFGRRKRIAIPLNLEPWDMENGPLTPFKKLCVGDEPEEESKSVLESLPLDLLIRVLCGVDHEDLKQLLLVSKPVAEATSIAKEMHFAYSTPRKVRAFRSPVDLSSSNISIDEIETPRAPRAVRGHKRLSEKDAAEISVSLFGSPKRKGSLFMDMEIDL